MTRPCLLTLIPMALATLLFAQPAQEADGSPSIENLATVIQAELGSHGDRVLGNGLYSWSTRLNKIEDCRAELSVRVTSNEREVTVRTETVNFSLGAIGPYSIELEKQRLQLHCVNNEKCVSSTSTCSAKTSSGIVIDCATPSQRRVESFTLEFDGNAEAASRLELAFRQAVGLCHVAQKVTF